MLFRIQAEDRKAGESSATPALRLVHFGYFRCLFWHWDRDGLASSTLSDPDRAACRLKRRGRIETLLYYSNAGLVAVDGDNRNLAAAILCDDQLSVCGAHPIRTLHRLVHPDIDRLPGFASRFD